MNKGQGLPITSVVLVIIAVVVVTVFIIYILTTSGKGFDITQNYWSSSGNLTKNASAQGAMQTDSCKRTDDVCNINSDCCDKVYTRCFKKYYDSTDGTCNACAALGEFCSSTNDCCSGLTCQGVGQSSHCQ
jgi:hypothetical protein